MTGTLTLYYYYKAAYFYKRDTLGGLPWHARNELPAADENSTLLCNLLRHDRSFGC